MNSRTAPPSWLWRLATGGFGLALAGVVALAWALSRGLADPPRAGPLAWFDDFQRQGLRWELRAPSGGSLAPVPGGLLATLPAGALALALAEAPAGTFTLEVAGAQTGGAPGAAYGLVFAWQDEAHYSAVLVNGNGYAEAYRQDGAERHDWFAWQQWPNILVGDAANRVRVDARVGHVTFLVNDEWLAEAETSTAGRVGVMGRGAAAGTVLFNWAKMWAASAR